jgi:hypothetical protein
MKRFALLPIVLIIGCATYDPYEPRRPQPQLRGETPLDAGVDVLPPPRWWRDYRIAEPLKLSEEQEKQLDALETEEPPDLHRLRREAMLAARELESAFDADSPSTAEIVEAGDRLRKTREELLGLEIKRVAAERAVLTRDQWRRLQQELHKEEVAQYARRYPDRPRVYPGWGPRGWPPPWWWPWY